MMLSFLLNNWLDMLLITVGLSAFGVYFWQKHDEKRIAATLIKGQIDIIEERVLILKTEHQLGNIAVYHSKTILQENLWEKYKHLLIKKLPKSDVEIIQKFFDSAEQIEHARSDIVQTISRAWEHKSQVEHQIVGEMVQSEIEKNFADKAEAKDQIAINMHKVECFRQAYRPLDMVFTPDISIAALVKYLSNFDTLSGTTAYGTIRSWSYDDK